MREAKDDRVIEAMAVSFIFWIFLEFFLLVVSGTVVGKQLIFLP